MCNYWANFITNSDPNGNDADDTPMETWEPYQDADPMMMTFYEEPKFVELQISERMELLVKAKQNYHD